MDQKLATNDAFKWYESAFIVNKSESGIRKCIEDIFGVELNFYCNILSGDTAGCFASEELYKTFLKTMDILRERLDDFYAIFLSKVKKEDIHIVYDKKEENTLKNFIEYLIVCSRKEFDIVLSNSEMRLIK